MYCTLHYILGSLHPLTTVVSSGNCRHYLTHSVKQTLKQSQIKIKYNLILSMYNKSGYNNPEQHAKFAT